MSFRIALNFEDGATRFIDCNAGEKVLDAAFRNKINLPMDCSDGVCGTCKCRCEQGEYELGDEYIDDALTAAEAAEGLVLTCQMEVSSDCVIAVPVPSGALKLKAEDIAVEIVAVDQLSNRRLGLAVRAASGSLPDFLAGQYVNIAVPGAADETRSYSFSSRPGADTGTFVIGNVAGGLMSRHLEKMAKAGDRLTLRGPLGSFYLRAPQRPLLFVAGGTGIAPILSMLEVLAAEGTAGHPVTLIYGVRNVTDLVGMEQIARLATRIPDLTIITTCSGLGEVHTRTGRVIAHLDAMHLAEGNVDIYLCGPPEMVETVRLHVAELGVTPANFYYEKFIPAQPKVEVA
ncbi:benzoate 1,2-dioxygenase electron transfer component BenC [Sphingomonas sp. BIUV-7]|uniref:Benzoate 1,2-dioxygenase electron transfer component BenC n=1 Tax=Sphingomonas natans TaxID=3063330 RepID=A0ABT8YAE0_9SPHN|nr:benzoate 1,2-dioxygenase electron transfer component BenC [Sphingomonas sp. BIUV-7]MDO6415307.1 benzoate 1,2-dioxygenase electron transfer component BenC [Sphingomonas sp. BIUV-7]